MYRFDSHISENHIHFYWYQSHNFNSEQCKTEEKVRDWNMNCICFIYKYSHQTRSCSSGIWMLQLRLELSHFFLYFIKFLYIIIGLWFVKQFNNLSAYSHLSFELFSYDSFVCIWFFHLYVNIFLVSNIKSQYFCNG